MAVTHIVLFQFKATADPGVVQAGCNHFLELGTRCVDPTTQTPYILSVQGGRDNSIASLQRGFTHAFIVVFATAEDRAYYMREDPAHAALVRSLHGHVEAMTVLDFSSGVF